MDSEDQVIFQGRLPGIYAEEIRRTRRFDMSSKQFHKELELYILLEGERYYFIEKDMYAVCAGMAVIINGDQIHKTSPCGRGPHRRFLLWIDPLVLEKRLSSLAGPNLSHFGDQYWGVCSFEKEEWNRILYLIAEIKTALRLWQKHDAELGLLLITELLIRCARSRGGDSGTGAEDSCRLVRDIAVFLQNHSAEHHCLDELAERFFVSTSCLTRLFKSATGLTIGEYRSFHRVKKACLLLAKSSLDITDIAEQTGFGNITYFERVFKRATGLTPLKYRKQAGENRG